MKQRCSGFPEAIVGPEDKGIMSSVNLEFYNPQKCISKNKDNLKEILDKKEKLNTPSLEDLL